MIEMMASLTVIVLVVAGAVTMSLTAMEASTVTRIELESVRGRIEGLRTLREELARARVESIAPDGSAITFSLPVPVGGGGAMLDPEGKVLWGAVDSSGPRLGGSYTVSFQPLGVLHEALRGLDLNGDGDMTDSFEIGRMVRTTDTGETLGFPTTKVAVVLGNRAGDIDGDGTPDPIFDLSATGQLSVRLARPCRGDQLDLASHRINPADPGL